MEKGSEKIRVALLGDARQVHIHRWSRYLDETGFDVLTLSLETVKGRGRLSPEDQRAVLPPRFRAIPSRRAGDTRRSGPVPAPRRQRALRAQLRPHRRARRPGAVGLERVGERCHAAPREERLSHAADSFRHPAGRLHHIRCDGDDPAARRARRAGGPRDHVSLRSRPQGVLPGLRARLRPPTETGPPSSATGRWNRCTTWPPSWTPSPTCQTRPPRREPHPRRFRFAPARAGRTRPQRRSRRRGSFHR